jgi:hypothetical protein
MTRDLHHMLHPAIAINQGAITSNTTTVSSVVDMRGYYALELYILSGSITDGTYTPLVEHADSSDFSDGAAVADTMLLGTELDAVFISTDDHKVKRIGYLGDKRYVRISLVSTGVTSGGTFTVLALRGTAANQPIA